MGQTKTDTAFGTMRNMEKKRDIGGYSELPSWNGTNSKKCQLVIFSFLFIYVINLSSFVLFVNFIHIFVLPDELRTETKRVM